MPGLRGLDRCLVLLCAVALVVTPLATLPMAAGQSSVTTIDDEHPLDSPDSVATFEETGNVSGSIVAPELRLSVGQRVAEGQSNQLLGQPNLDPAFVYFRVQYNETLPRTIRIYMPAGYWYPFPSNIEAESAGTTAQLRPSENASYTVVTLHLDGKTDAVFQIPLVASSTYVARDLSRAVWENATGIEVPRLGSAETWHYLNRSALAGKNTTVSIATGDRETIIQYDAAPGQAQRWLLVPDCGGTLSDNAPVCKFRRPGAEQRVHLLARERFDADNNPPPTIRYKFAEDSMTGGISLGSIVDGVAVTVNRAVGFFGSLLSG